MAKSIVVKKVDNEDLIPDYNILQKTFTAIDSNPIDNCPWVEQFPYIPEVVFKIVHTEEAIGLYYHIKEEFHRASAIRPNENVWEDSCVEFFISVDNKETYYNFEFNILGTGLIGYGSAIKSERQRKSAGEIEKVNTLTQVKKVNGNKIWEIFLIIPKELITTVNLSGKTAHANFYKCGDALPNPHFLAWNNIENDKPNFHMPAYFGEMNFE